MGRTEPGGYSTRWTPPSYTVDESGKVVGGYRPEGPNNWGRWGDDDQRGTQNLIGPAERVAAAGLVRTGKVFSLALPIDRTAPSLSSRPAPMLLPLMTGSDAVVGSPYNEAAPGFQWSDDMLQMPTQGSTQWDAFGHVMWQDTMYNGYWAGNMTTLGGGRVLGIDHHRESFVGRGVLVDVPRVQGLDACPDNQVIGPDLLDAALEAQGTELLPGDMLLVRTGHLARWWSLTDADDRDAYFMASPGVGRDAIPWLHERSVSALATDTLGAEPLIPEQPMTRVLPLHVACLVDLGLPLGELWVLDPLADDCAEDGAYAFMLIAPPLYLPGGMGSPLNPIAIK
ncbi:MAG TPA: cyclase family protein [Miltoncostaeaceae bacterium]|nr:cyclase family protein [Miltoncostaeaceae bacterium]